MARTKALKNPSRQHHKRTSWTRFHLPRGQDWPAWSTGQSDAHLGPLTGVAGCQKVWLGRKVDDPEQAALIVLWETAAALKAFQASPACEEFLQALPQKDAQVSLLSGALLRDMSLDDADDASLPSAKSRSLSYQWTQGYRFEEDLQGRITITAFALPSTSATVLQSWYRVVYNAFSQFLPSGCQDLCGQHSRMHFWTSWAWVDSDVWYGGEHQVVSAGNDGGRTVLCEFRRWNGYGGATPEREEASAKDPLAKESWAQKLATVMPPVTAWEQERWDFQSAPVKVIEQDEEEEGEEEDLEYEGKLTEFLDQQLGRGKRQE